MAVKKTALSSEQILFRVNFWELVKHNYSVEEISAFTGIGKSEIRRRINNKGKHKMSKESLICFYKKNYKRKVGELFYKRICG